MIKVHHLNNSRSQRVLWLLEELALPYEIIAYKRNPKTMLAPPNLKAIHPLGKSPIIEDGTLILAETGAILDYLVTRYGPNLAPAADHALHWRHVYWMHYAEGSAMPPLLLKLILNRMGFLGLPARGYVDGQIKLHLDFLEAELRDNPWFVGDSFTASDIMLSFPLEVAKARGALTPAHRKLSDFLARVQARPAYLRAIERGGKYDLGF